MVVNKRRPSKAGQTSPKHRKSLREPASSSKDDEDVGVNDIKKVLVDIKESWRYLQKNRFKVLNTSKGPYKSDRWIWQGVILVVFLWLWFIAHSYDYNLDYFKCGEGYRLYESGHQTCPNPFYEPENSWKNIPELPYGEYGQKPGPLFNSAGIVAFFIMVLALVLNHVWHNRRFKLR